MSKSIRSSDYYTSLHIFFSHHYLSESSKADGEVTTEFKIPKGKRVYIYSSATREHVYDIIEALTRRRVLYLSAFPLFSPL